MAHAWDWAVWKGERAPGWWTAISTDPPIELRARTEGALRAKMLLAERGDHEPVEMVGVEAVVDIAPPEVVGARCRPNPVRPEVAEGRRWQTSAGMVPLYDERGGD